MIKDRKEIKIMNKIILVGRLTKDVELRYTQTNNTAVASFTLAVDRKIVKAGEERKSDFINIVAWSKLADIASKNLSKGVRVGIIGSIQNRSWEKEDGTKKYVTEVIAEEIEFLDSKRKEGPDIGILTGNTNNEEIVEHIEVPDDSNDLPF